MERTLVIMTLELEIIAATSFGRHLRFYKDCLQIILTNKLAVIACRLL